MGTGLALGVLWHSTMNVPTDTAAHTLKRQITEGVSFTQFPDKCRCHKDRRAGALPRGMGVRARPL